MASLAEVSSYHPEHLVKSPYGGHHMTLSEVETRQRIYYGEQLLALNPTERKHKRHDLHLSAYLADQCMQIAGIFGSKSPYDHTLVCRLHWKVLEGLSLTMTNETLRHRVIRLLMHWMEHFWNEKYLHPEPSYLPIVTCPHALASSVPTIELALNGYNYEAIAIMYAHMQEENHEFLDEPELLALPLQPLVGRPVQSVVVPVREKEESAPAPSPYDDLSSMIEQVVREQLQSQLHDSVALLLGETVRQVVEQEVQKGQVEIAVRHERLLYNIEASIQGITDRILRDSFARRLGALEHAIDEAFTERGEQLVALVRDTYQADQQELIALKERNVELQRDLVKALANVQEEAKKRMEAQQRLRDIREWTLEIGEEK